MNDSDLPSQGWVNTHLQYTHGYAMILAPSNQQNGNQPAFSISQVPPQSTPGAPTIKQPRVYFGLSNPNGGDVDYVLGDTRQPEIDYQAGSATGNPVDSTYKGKDATGGVQLKNFLVKAAFAIRFGDFNLLVSDLVTSHSRLMFVRDITQMAQKAAPFLSYDSDPYPVLADGQIYWVLDAYTTSDNYPYAQNIDTSSLPSNSGLNQNINYVRNSVKVVVNAYSGQMTFYDVTALTRTKDPILQTWEKVFPGMFTPVSQMPPALRAHLRYPEDLLNVQTAAYGRYHITQPLAFYNATNAWNVSQSAGAGSPNQALPTTFTTNAQGAIVSTGQVARMAPIYELFQVPGQSSQSFNLVDAFVPVSKGDQIQTMSAFMVAGSDPATVRQADGVPDATHRRTGPRRRRHRRHPEDLVSDQPAQPERFQCRAGHAASRAGGRLDAVLPALLRGVLAQPVPRARLLRRRLRRRAGPEPGRLRHHAVGGAATTSSTCRCPARAPPRHRRRRPVRLL